MPGAIIMSANLAVASELTIRTRSLTPTTEYQLRTDTSALNNVDPRDPLWIRWGYGQPQYCSMPSKDSVLQPGVDPLPSQLLHYLAAYKVLVCTECLYAIQPNAITRHLKDIHDIKRSRRRPYMQYASDFELAPQELVVDLTPLEFPVPMLPVQDGFQCLEEKCFHLCITEKRMKSHWLSVHRRSELLSNFGRGSLF